MRRRPSGERRATLVGGEAAYLVLSINGCSKVAVQLSGEELTMVLQALGSHIADAEYAWLDEPSN